MKNIKALAEWGDSIVGGAMSAWGCFAVIFFCCTPLIIVGAGIRWLIENGYLG